jgi:hypothetical protein
MLNYNNNHIFTGYLKQLLSSFSLPACKVYTYEFAKYFDKYGVEDPRVLESFDDMSNTNSAIRINYLKNAELYHYFWNPEQANKQFGLEKAFWRQSAELFHNKDKFIPGLSRRLDSPGINYDTKTHEYLGDFLRFIRDYHDINLMSLYNCFTDKIYNNINFPFVLNPEAAPEAQIKILINAQEPEYRLYALPVKLFANYTIAVDCDQGIEMFCGLYNTKLDVSSKAQKFAAKTYQKVHKTIFNQPFLYTKLGMDYWTDRTNFIYKTNQNTVAISNEIFTPWDLTSRERDLKLFIKVPVSCRSSIVILEGDFRNFNDKQYKPIKGIWKYTNNHCVLNFSTRDRVDLNDYSFSPVSQLQLLAFNTGESYPFADRLIEYLGGSAITPIDDIHDNIARVQRVMRQNQHYFKIEGLWEPKMQNIIYDYMMNSGPITVDEKTGKLVDEQKGYHRTLGHNNKSTIFDILGYADKDVEKWYVSWKKNPDTGKVVVGTSLQNVDIYDGLYDI